MIPLLDSEKFLTIMYVQSPENVINAPIDKPSSDFISTIFDLHKKVFCSKEFYNIY